MTTCVLGGRERGPPTHMYNKGLWPFWRQKDYMVVKGQDTKAMDTRVIKENTMLQEYIWPASP